MEVIIIVVVGFLIIGPDRLPGVMKEIRAVRLAIKNAVADARKQIDGELGEDLREFRTPPAIQFVPINGGEGIHRQNPLRRRHHRS